MQLERTRRLVEKLRAYRDENAVPQVRLAAELNLSPANLSEILRGNNSPNSETTLQIIELIEPQFMRIIVDPPAAPRTSTRDPNIPRTLSSALEKIDLLQSRIKQLEQPQHGATAPLVPASAHSVKTAEPFRNTKPTPTAGGSIKNPPSRRRSPWKGAVSREAQKRRFAAVSN